MLDRRVLLAGLEVVEDEVPVRERAALGVLAGQAHGRAVGEEAAEGECLRLRPVDAALLAERVPAALELLHELRVDREALGHVEQLLVQLPQPVGGNGRVDLGVGTAADPALLPPRRSCSNEAFSSSCTARRRSCTSSSSRSRLGSA